MAARDLEFLLNSDGANSNMLGGFKSEVQR